MVTARNALAFLLTHFPANGGSRLRDSQAFCSFKSRVRLDISNRMGEILIYGEGFEILARKNLLFFSELVGRVGIEPTTN
jgi:hypothetical protein